MKRLVLLVCVGVLSLGLFAVTAACSQPQNNNGSSNQNSSQNSDGKQQSKQNQDSSNQASDEAQVEFSFEGTNLKVSLAGNQTTGYSWVPSVDGSSVVMSGTDYIVNESDGNMVGVGGMFVYDFKGVSEGTTNIDFSYQQVWDPKDDDLYVLLEVKTAADGTIESVNRVK